MTTYRRRWSDNDHTLGPFLYAYAAGEHGYRTVGVLLSSGDGDERAGCNLRVSLGRHTFIVSLPQFLLQPWRRKVHAGWDDATTARLGRDWYYDSHPREYGFSFCSSGRVGNDPGRYDFFQIYLGRQTNDSSTEQRWSKFLPWHSQRFVRHSLYNLDGSLFADLPQGRWGSPEYELEQALLASCPTVVFPFTDFDGEQLTVTTKIDEREWRRGEGWFKWLSVFFKPIVHRSLDLRFSGETGKRKGSWKGGTIGHSIEMLSGELHESAFRRYCAENNMTFSEAR